MSRSISSIPTSELNDLNFVDLDEQEMSTLAGGLVTVGNVADGGVTVNADQLAQNAAQNVNVGPVEVNGPLL